MKEKLNEHQSYQMLEKSFEIFEEVCLKKGIDTKAFGEKLFNVNMNDKVLDAICGFGSFLVKAMCNMIKEAGGVNAEKAKLIKSEQLFGIEMYRKIYALACANMMINKDGKTNLKQMDAKSKEAGEWIKDINIIKVLINPPYEMKYSCVDIVINVLNNVPVGTKCVFILLDKKIEKETKLKKALKNHILTTIVKLLENLLKQVILRMIKTLLVIIKKMLI